MTGSTKRQSTPGHAANTFDDQLDRKIHVLVADDHADVLLATADLVMDHPGVLVDSLAIDVDEVTRAVAAHSPDLLLIDAWINGGGARAVLPQVARLSPRTIVVALVSTREPELSRQLAAAGVFGCFEKESLGSVLPRILSAIRDREPLID